MATTTIDRMAERRLEEEAFRLQKLEGRDGGMEQPRVNGHDGLKEAGPELALAPLVDRIAYGFAKGLVVAMQELENHIATETRKVGDTVGRRLDTLQASFQDLTDVVSQQRSMSIAVQNQCEQLAAVTASLQQSDARQQAELSALRNEAAEFSTAVSERVDAVSQQLSTTTSTLQESDARHEAELSVFRNETREFSKAVSDRIDALCKDLSVHQEDLAAVKQTLSGFTSKMDALVERLDRQAEALRSMYSSYSQRETELEQLVDGLARLRAYPAPAPANGL